MPKAVIHYRESLLGGEGQMSVSRAEMVRTLQSRMKLDASWIFDDSEALPILDLLVAKTGGNETIHSLVAFRINLGVGLSGAPKTARAIVGVTDNRVLLAYIRPGMDQLVSKLTNEADQRALAFVDYPIESISRVWSRRTMLSLGLAKDLLLDRKDGSLAKIPGMTASRCDGIQGDVMAAMRRRGYLK